MKLSPKATTLTLALVIAGLGYWHVMRGGNIKGMKILLGQKDSQIDILEHKIDSVMSSMEELTQRLELADSLSDYHNNRADKLESTIHRSRERFNNITKKELLNTHDSVALGWFNDRFGTRFDSNRGADSLD